MASKEVGRTIIHEIGHYVAANSGPDLIGGHICVDADMANGVTAGFGWAPEYHDRLVSNVALCAFVAATGAIAEKFFHGKVNDRALRPDLLLYRQLRLPNTPASDAELLRLWERNYGATIVHLSDCIKRNADRCVELLETGEFMIDEYHVIPTSSLEPPIKRHHSERTRERDVTASMTARRKALIRYLMQRPAHHPRLVKIQNMK